MEGSSLEEQFAALVPGDGFDLAGLQDDGAFVAMREVVKAPKAIFYGHPQLGKGAGVGQHEADANLAALGQYMLRQQQAGSGGAHEGGALSQDMAAVGVGVHHSLLVFECRTRQCPC